jgi:DNA-binding MarR family transcriptional regulator
MVERLCNDLGFGERDLDQAAPAPAGSGAIPPALLREADGLRRSLSRIARELRKLRADHGISASKLSVLGRLHRAGGPLTAVDLARQERLQPQSLTRIIAELDERGLVSRRPDETDRRQVLIDIAPPGRELLVLDARAQNAWLAASMDTKLTGTEQALLILAAKLLDRLAEAG